MRLFVALDLDDQPRREIKSFMEEVRQLAPAARWVSAESLHITLKFIGETRDDLVKKIESELSSIKSGTIRLRFKSSGFFPTPRAARVFWIGIEAEPALARLAGLVDESLLELGIPKEDRAFSPHLTLARASGGSGSPGKLKSDKPNRQFAKLQELLEKSPAPDFGTMTAREFFLYRSQLSNKGAQYMKIARFSLSGEK